MTLASLLGATAPELIRGVTPGLAASQLPHVALVLQETICVAQHHRAARSTVLARITPARCSTEMNSGRINGARYVA